MRYFGDIFQGIHTHHRSLGDFKVQGPINPRDFNHDRSCLVLDDVVIPMPLFSETASIVDTLVIYAIREV